MRITSLKQTTAEHVTVVLEDESEVKTTLGTVTELRARVPAADVGKGAE